MYRCRELCRTAVFTRATDYSQIIRRSFPIFSPRPDVLTLTRLPRITTVLPFGSRGRLTRVTSRGSFVSTRRVELSRVTGLSDCLSTDSNTPCLSSSRSARSSAAQPSGIHWRSRSRKRIVSGGLVPSRETFRQCSRATRLALGETRPRWDYLLGVGNGRICDG